jgi:hypothetical protein
VAAPGEAHADASHLFRRRGERFPGAPRAPQRDHRGGDVLAGVVATRAVAVPVLVVERDAHRRREQAAPRGDAQHDLVALVAFPVHGVTARELDAR